MDFDLNDEQRLLKDSVDRMIGDLYGFEARRGYRAQPDGWSREMWHQFAEQGLLGLPFAENQGGFGGGPVEVAIVMEAFGRALVVEPYLATVVLCGGLLRHAASDDQLAELVPAIAAGERVLAYAQAERQSRWSLNDVSTQAVPDGTGWRVTGDKTLVLNGDSADAFLVTARTAGTHREAPRHRPVPGGRSRRDPARLSHPGRRPGGRGLVRQRSRPGQSATRPKSCRCWSASTMRPWLPCAPRRWA